MSSKDDNDDDDQQDPVRPTPSTPSTPVTQVLYGPQTPHVARPSSGLLETDADSPTTAVRQLTGELAQLKAKHGTEVEALKQQVHEHHQSLVRKIRTLEDALEAELRLKVEAKEETGKLADKLKELTRKFEVEKAGKQKAVQGGQAYKRRFKEAEEKLQIADKLAQDAQKIAERLKSHLEESQTALSQSESEKRTAQNGVNELTEKMAQLERSKTQADDEVKRWKDEFTDLFVQTEELVSKLEVASDAQKKLQLELNQAKAELTVKSGILAEQEASRQVTVVKYFEMKAKLEEDEATFTRKLKETEESMQSKLALSEQQFESLMAEKQTANRWVRKLTRQNTELKAQLEGEKMCVARERETTQRLEVRRKKLSDQLDTAEHQRWEECRLRRAANRELENAKEEIAELKEQVGKVKRASSSGGRLTGTSLASINSQSEQ